MSDFCLLLSSSLEFLQFRRRNNPQCWRVVEESLQGPTGVCGGVVFPESKLLLELMHRNAL